MSQQYGPPEPHRPTGEPGLTEPGRDGSRSGPGYSEPAPTASPHPGMHPQEAHPVRGPRTPPSLRAGEPARERPAVPRWLGQLAYAFVLCGVAAGLAVVVANHFRRGSMLIAASVFIGALARLLLPESQVGMLAVRRRWLDVLLMMTAAVGITLVAFVAKGTAD